MLYLIRCPHCRIPLPCYCQMYSINNRIMIGSNFLLEYHDDMIRLFKYEPIDDKFRYHTSREIIDNEIQWLKIDDVIVPLEIQKHINSVIKNLAFL